jgi:hypothetical protein
MSEGGLPPVPRTALLSHVRQALARYWPANEDALAALPVIERPFPALVGELRLILVALPSALQAATVEGCLAVPREACTHPDAPRWEDVDWWLAAFLMLEGWHERAWENRRGPIHSYAVRLRAFDSRLWERAWVNRIALFLRQWAASRAEQEANTLLGPLPEPEWLLTHDVDAVDKTWPIRLKQGAFLGANALRLAARARVGSASRRAGAMLRFVLGREDWWSIDSMIEIEQRAGLRSRFHFRSDERRRNPTRWLFDPAYDVMQPRLQCLLARLRDGGFDVGLHQSFDAWRSATLMRRQRERLEQATHAPVRHCRQHWLRFSWAETWAAQADAGFAEDTTLMFNDRPGLRSAAALRWSPWNAESGRPHALAVLPTVMMDSHLYDYRPLEASERRATMRRWFDEIAAVSGQAALLWHPHTLTRDYGWRAGFEELVAELRQRMPGAMR